MDAESYVEIEIIATTHNFQVKKVVRVKDQMEFAKKELTNLTSGNIARFQNEVRLLARLDHPNIIRVVDQQLAGFPMYAITPLYKENLRCWLRHSDLENPISDRDRQQVFDRIVDAVEYAHGQGVIHRDIKPENVLVNSCTDVVVIDFNISSAPMSGEATRQTRTGETLGTPHYIAPEQLTDTKRADVRADVYSLGVVLFEIFGGRVGSSTLAIDALPGVLKSVVQRCVDATPARRYQTVTDLKQAWRLACDLNNKQSEVNEIESAILQWDAGAPGKISAHKLFDLLTSYGDNVDLLDRFFMGCPIELVGELSYLDEQRLEKLLEIWTEFFSSQSWPFDYTDKIAVRCNAIWNVVDSAISRARLTVSLIRLGNRHNRYMVWKTAARMISRTMTPNVGALMNDLFQLEERELRGVREYIDRVGLRAELWRVINRQPTAQSA
jgi:serine/threonine protein kinase